MITLFKIVVVCRRIINTARLNSDVGFICEQVADEMSIISTGES